MLCPKKLARTVKKQVEERKTQIVPDPRQITVPNMINSVEVILEEFVRSSRLLVKPPQSVTSNSKKVHFESSNMGSDWRYVEWNGLELTDMSMGDEEHPTFDRNVSDVCFIRPHCLHEYSY